MITPSEWLIMQAFSLGRDFGNRKAATERQYGYNRITKRRRLGDAFEELWRLTRERHK